MAIERSEQREQFEGDARAVARRAQPSADDERSSSMRVARWRHKVALALESADSVIDGEPDRAAWLLDEALHQMIGLWLARHGRGVRLDGKSLDGIEDVIEWADPCVGLQLRLALRASDVRVRRRHCRALLVLIEREDVGLEQADAGCAALHAVAHRPLEAGQPRLEHDDESIYVKGSAGQCLL
jgi:hypothetical protein